MIKRMVSVLLAVMMVVSVVAIGVVNTGGAETDAVVTGWSIPSEIEFFQKLVTLRTRYPNGSTWDGTYYEGEKPKAFTAWGYACQIMYEVFGAMFYADSLLNYKDYSTSNLCAGDWVRIDSDSHSIFITKVTSGGVYYTDCNGTGVYNQIRWDGYCSWSEFRNRFSYRVHLPGNSLKGDYHEHIPCEPVQENVVPATCKFEGTYDEVIYCTKCGEEISRETKIINKLAHTPGESVIENIIPATCKFEGTYDEVVYCTECGEEISREQKTIDKLAHTPGEPVQENVTVTHDKTTYDEVVYCTECSEEISRVAKTIDKLDHTPGEAVQENVVPASCTVNGSYDVVVYCTECGEELSRETKIIDKIDHTLGEPVKENDTSSCLESGTYDEVVYCSECGQEISRETKNAEPLGHQLVFVKQVYPTYSRNGRYAHYECDRCGKLYADATGTHEISEDILMIPMLVEETWAPEPSEPETEPPTEPEPIESVYGDFAYKLYSDGHIEITKYNGNDTTVSVSSEIDGHPVTLIGEKAFYGNTALTEVTIPNSVKFIGSNAFSHCSALENVNLPESIKSLSSGLFSYCTSLKNVTIPSSVTNIGYNAFYHCFSLTDISIPESVTSINSQAFDWCPSLKQVNIPKSVKSIGAKAFGYVCDQKIDGFKILGYKNSAAHKYAKVNSFDFESTGYIFVPPTEPQPTSPYPEPTEPSTEPATEPTPGQIGDKTYNLNTNNKTATLQKYSGYSANVSIPSQEYIHHYYYSDSGYYNITAIGNAAFAGNSYVKSVTIPNTVTTIGDDAFFRCSSLSNVTIPDSVTSIGCCAFAQCNNLNSVTIPSSVTFIGEKAFGFIDANTKVDGFTITGRTGSAAYKYAVKNGFEFVANDSNISGDVDSDYAVTVMDATAIQAYLAYQRSLNGGEYEPVEKGSRDFTVADVDGDGRISIFDSLRIQRYCAKMCKLDGSPYDD